MKMPWELAEVWKPGDTVIGRRNRLGIQSRLNRYCGCSCPYCGVVMNRDRGWNSPQAPSRDHRHPKSRGGISVTENLLICCRGCNEEKGNLTVDEFMAVRAGFACRIDKMINTWRSVQANKRAQEKRKAKWASTSSSSTPEHRTGSTATSATTS